MDTSPLHLNTPATPAGQNNGELTFLPRADLVVKTMPTSTSTESIHALRTHLVARHISQGKRGIAICEPSPSGATFIAVNLAVSLAEAGTRTMLIDANLRAPELNQYLQPSQPVVGLNEVIEQADLPFGRAIYNVLPNLSLMFAGPARENVQEVLGNTRFPQMIQSCMREFDFTIVITPPSNRSADGRLIASIVRNALVVARKDVTFLSDVNTLIKELEEHSAEVLGTIYSNF